MLPLPSLMPPRMGSHSMKNHKCMSVENNAFYIIDANWDTSISNRNRVFFLPLLDHEAKL